MGDAPRPGDSPLRWVLALGIGSLLLLVAGAWSIDRRAGAAFEALGRVGRLDATTATAHLWLEELVSGDAAVPPARVRASLEAGDEAWTELRALLDGDPLLRHRLEEITYQLNRFRSLSFERLENHGIGAAVGIGTVADEAYDRAFDDLGVALGSLRVALDDELLALRSTARRGLGLLVASWSLLIGISSLVLARRRREHRRAELALAASQDRFLASQKMEAVGRLAGGVAHDINNYLAAINAQCELVLRRAGGDDLLRKRMETAIATVFRASALIQQLLAFSRRQPSRPRVVDLDSVVDRLDPMMRQLVGAGVRMSTRSGDAPRVRIDPVRLEQVLLNLVVNARDAMPNGGTLEIATARREGRAELRVRDEGPGIPPDRIERIFEPFFTTKGGSGASGLGLSTVLGIVEQAGGRVEVESEPGVGTTFAVSWPEDPAQVETDPEQEVGAEIGSGSESILLVEDNATLREASAALLGSLGYRVRAAGTAEEALAALAGEGASPPEGSAPDLLIADLVLPGLGGRDLADRLRERDPGLRVLFVTGYTDDPELRRRVREGKADLLEKPFTSHSLLRAIRRILDGPTADARGLGPPGEPTRRDRRRR